MMADIGNDAAKKASALTLAELYLAALTLMGAKVVVCGSDGKPHIVHPSARGKALCLNCLAPLKVGP